MAAPLKTVYSGSDFSYLKEMSSTDIDNTFVGYILSQFISQAGTGDLSINDSNGGTSIGTFTDQMRDDDIGTHPTTGTTTDTTYTFRQKLDAVTPDNSNNPLKLASGQLKPFTEAEVISDIIDRVLNSLTSFGVGSYKLQPSAPSTGTWTSIGTVTNSNRSGNNTTTLWRRTDSFSYSNSERPVKHTTSPVTVKEMTDGEIKALVGHLRKAITDSGVGKYVLQENAPSTGTWTRAGAEFSDTRKEVGNQNYTGSYTGSYTGIYAGITTSTGTASYASSFSGNYVGFYPGNYAGSRSFTGYYSGSRSYTAYYGGAPPVQSGYAGATYTSHGDYARTETFSGIYSGTRPHDYAGSRWHYYEGNAQYTGYANYTGTYSGTYTGTYTGATILSTDETVSNISLWLRTA